VETVRVARTEAAEGRVQKALLALQRVHFAYDSAKLLADARASLDVAAEALRARARVDIYVEGHADERGSDTYNMRLSERRARSVAEYLASRGVERRRLGTVAKGKREPLAKGRGERPWAENRRVEFRLIRGDAELIIEEGPLFNDRGKRLSTAAADTFQVRRLASR
jgi:outer membrane protein OmpA-like peptidoglycan-associated protein